MISMKHSNCQVASCFQVLSALKRIAVRSHAHPAFVLQTTMKKAAATTGLTAGAASTKVAKVKVKKKPAKATTGLTAGAASTKVAEVAEVKVKKQPAKAADGPTAGAASTRVAEEGPLALLDEMEELQRRLLRHFLK